MSISPSIVAKKLPRAFFIAVRAQSTTASIQPAQPIEIEKQVDTFYVSIIIIPSRCVPSAVGYLGESSLM